MKIHRLIEFLDTRFPRHLQEGYDNSGDQIVFPGSECTGITLALDVTPGTVQQAIANGSNCLVTHHPLFFRGISSLVADDPVDNMVMELVKRGITVFSLHTNLDAVFHDAQARVLGLQADMTLTGRENGTGMGSVSTLDPPLRLDDLLELVTHRFDLQWVTYRGDGNRLIRRIAILGGSGGRFIEKELPSLDVDCIITGDVGYHAWMLASMYDRAVIDAGHFGTERLFLTFLECEIRDFLTKTEGKADIQLFIASEQNPVHLYSRGI